MNQGQDRDKVAGFLSVLSNCHCMHIHVLYMSRQQHKGLATLEAFTCFYFLTKSSSNVFLMRNQNQRALTRFLCIYV